MGRTANVLGFFLEAPRVQIPSPPQTPATPTTGAVSIGGGLFRLDYPTLKLGQ